jgi:glycerol kinase
MNAILALDAGTTNVKAILVDRQANILARSSVPLAIQFPKSGWVEQSARDIWNAARKALRDCLVQGAGHEAVALGISNQRKPWWRGIGSLASPYALASFGNAAVPRFVKPCARKASRR